MTAYTDINGGVLLGRMCVHFTARPDTYVLYVYYTYTELDRVNTSDIMHCIIRTFAMLVLWDKI